MSSVNGINGVSLQSAIESLSKLNTITSGNDASSTGETQSFSSILDQLLGNVAQTEEEDHLSTLQLLTGTMEFPHDSTIASTKAELELRLALQIRNKAVEAYQEIMRMQV